MSRCLRKCRSSERNPVMIKLNRIIIELVLLTAFGLALAAAGVFSPTRVHAADPTNPWLDDSTCTQQEQYYVSMVEWLGGLCNQADVNDKWLLNTYLVEQYEGAVGFTDFGTPRLK